MIKEKFGTVKIYIDTAQTKKLRENGFEMIVYWIEAGKSRVAPMSFLDNVFQTSKEFLEFHKAIWPAGHI